MEPAGPGSYLHIPLSHGLLHLLWNNGSCATLNRVQVSSLGSVSRPNLSLPSHSSQAHVKRSAPDASALPPTYIPRTMRVGRLLELCNAQTRHQEDMHQYPWIIVYGWWPAWLGHTGLEQ